MHAFNESKRRRPLRRVRIAMTAVAIGGAVAACGGSSSDNGTPPSAPAPAATSNMPPTSASESVDGFIAYLKILVATPQDTAQPLDVANFVAPTTETGTPDLSF